MLSLLGTVTEQDTHLIETGQVVETEWDFTGVGIGFDPAVKGRCACCPGYGQV